MGMVLEVLVLTNIARKFEWFVEAYRRPDGRRWGGQDLQDATNGIVQRSYITNLRQGRIENPGYEKLAAIAKAMGFPPGLWFEDLGPGIQPEAAEEGQNLSDRLDRLLNTSPTTGPDRPTPTPRWLA